MRFYKKAKRKVFKTFFGLCFRLRVGFVFGAFVFVALV